MHEISKSDWKKVRERVGKWQENYMEKLLKEWVVFLQTDEPASKKFWELNDKIRQAKKCKGVIITDMRKSAVIYDIADLIRENAIQLEDLADFSEELQDAVRRLVS